MLNTHASRTYLGLSSSLSRFPKPTAGSSTLPGAINRLNPLELSYSAGGFHRMPGNRCSCLSNLSSGLLPDFTGRHPFAREITRRVFVCWQMNSVVLAHERPAADLLRINS